MPLKRQFAAVLSAMVQTVRSLSYLQHCSVTCWAKRRADCSRVDVFKLLA